MKYWIIVFICMLALGLSGQEHKRNNNWVLGLGPTVKFNFNNGLNMTTLPTFVGTSLHNSCISDTNGNFLFYSVGYRFVTKSGDTMSNYDSLNCPGGGKMASHYGWGSLYPQNDIIIPKSGNQYYVFATGMHDSNWTKWKSGLGFNGWDYLNYSVVDMDSNNGMGKVLLKNQVVLDSQSYSNCAMSAVRHANGKDWWLVHEDWRKDGYQIFRVTPDSIIGPTYQYVPVGKRGNFWAEQTSLVFSPDGTKMASTMYTEMIDSTIFPPLWDYNRVDVFDFNNTTGELTYLNKYIIPSEYDTDSMPPNLAPNAKRGICFSPNSKLLYMSAFYTIYQLDLSDTIVNGGYKVSGQDTATDMHNTMALAPDCKIYIGNFNGFQSMSTIENPNVKGSGCNYNMNSVHQTFTYLQSPPNMPFYGINHPCEPLGVEEITKSEDEIIVYPNPASTILYVQSQKYKQLKKELYNSLGQLVLSTTKNELDISGLSVGLYYLRVGNFTKKIVKE